MARDIRMMNSLLGPGACCDACARPNWDMGSEGSLCYHCGRGVFMHRRFWVYTFDGEEFVAATPRETVDEAMMQAEWQELAKTVVRSRHAIAEPLAQVLALAQAPADGSA